MPRHYSFPWNLFRVPFLFRKAILELLGKRSVLIKGFWKIVVFLIGASITGIILAICLHKDISNMLKGGENVSVGLVPK